MTPMLPDARTAGYLWSSCIWASACRAFDVLPHQCHLAGPGGRLPPFACDGHGVLGEKVSQQTSGRWREPSNVASPPAVGTATPPAGAGLLRGAHQVLADPRGVGRLATWARIVLTARRMTAPSRRAQCMFPRLRPANSCQGADGCGSGFFFPPKLFEQLPRSQCKLRSKGAYGLLAKRQPARGAIARSNTSPNGSASGAPGSGGMVQTPSAELATARCRATDSTLHQRRAQPWVAAARKGGGARWTRSRSKVRRNCWHSSLQRPPTSAARTTSR